MKKQNQTTLFAFKLAENNQSVKSEDKWQANKKVATAGCSGPWARADHRYRGRDQGIWC